MNVDKFFQYISQNNHDLFRDNLHPYVRNKYQNKFAYRGIIINEKELNNLKKNKFLKNRYNRNHSAWTLNPLSKYSNKELISEFDLLADFCRPSLSFKKRYLVILKRKLNKKEIILDIPNAFNIIERIPRKYKTYKKYYIEEENELILRTNMKYKDIIKIIKLKEDYDY